MLARQRLLERSREPIPRVLERMGGLQAQYAPSMYIGLWSRIAGFERDALTRALERRDGDPGDAAALDDPPRLRGATSGRSRVAVREARRAWWLRTRRGAVTEADDGARRRAVARAPRRRSDAAHGDRWSSSARSAARGVGLWVDLVRVPPSGTWERRRADLFALAERWVGPPRRERRRPRSSCSSAATSPRFGPATRRGDRRLGRASAGDRARGRSSALDTAALPGRGRRRARSTCRARRCPTRRRPRRSRFLPTWDATLLAHARRALILPEEDRPQIFTTKTPQSFPTFLVDGRVAGTWRHEDGRIALRPFRRLDAADRRALEEEGERLAAFHA